MVSSQQMQAHIRTLRGRILETILSLRFFIFQYGIVYKLHASGSDTSLTVNNTTTQKKDSVNLDLFDNIFDHPNIW